MGKVILVYKPLVTLPRAVAHVKRGLRQKMRMWRLGECYSAFLIKRSAMVTFADHLNLCAGSCHMRMRQVSAEAMKLGNIWRLEITQKKAPDLQTRCLYIFFQAPDWGV